MISLLDLPCNASSYIQYLDDLYAIDSCVTTYYIRYMSSTGSIVEIYIEVLMKEGSYRMSIYHDSLIYSSLAECLERAVYLIEKIEL